MCKRLNSVTWDRIQNFGRRDGGKNATNKNSTIFYKIDDIQRKKCTFAKKIKR
jgi:hypothetical protein